MEPEQDETAFEWIRSGRDELGAPEKRSVLSPGLPGVFVSHLMPEVFEAYARILHRVEARYDVIDNPLSAAEIAVLKIPPCEPLKSFVERRRASGQGTGVRWKELATLLNVPFAAEISFEWYRSKLEGWCLSRFLRSGGAWPVGEECKELVSSLSPYTGDAQCFFRFSDIPFVGKSKPPLFKGSIGGVSDFLKTGTYRYGFEYWWPSDHAWCVCADFDLDVTVVGGCKELISALLASNVLECIEVKSRTHVDPFVPMPTCNGF